MKRERRVTGEQTMRRKTIALAKRARRIRRASVKLNVSSHVV